MKMIMAILHKDDELDTIEELNRNKFFVTKLSDDRRILKKQEHDHYDRYRG